MGSEALFRQHAPFVARFLTRFGIPRGDQEDLVQEVFLVVHRLGGYEPGPALPTSFLASIAFRAAVTHLRKRRTRSFVRVDGVATAAASAPGDPASDLEARESLRRVQAALDSLEPDHRLAFVLFELEGQPCDSIAAALGVPVGTIYSRLHSARRQFRRAFDTAPDRECARPGRRAVG